LRSIRAFVEITPQATVSIAGIPVLARAVLSLWAAGITRFTVRSSDPTPTYTHAPALAEIARVAPSLRLNWIGQDGVDRQAFADGKVVVVSTDGIFRADLITRLLADAGDAPLMARLPSNGESFIKVVSDGAPRAAVQPRTVELTPNDFYPIRTPDEAAVAERGLFRWCIKETDGIVSRYLNRPLSGWISRRISHTTLRPTQLTVVTGLSALLMFSTLVSGSVFLIGVGCVLYHITSVLDGLDGEIARAKYMSSPRGAALDTAVDMATNLLFILGVSLADENVYDPVYGWVGGYIAFVALVAMATMALALHFGPGGGSFDVLQLTIRHRLQRSPRLARAFNVVNAFFKRDMFALVFAVIGAVGCAYAIPWMLAFGVTMWLTTVLINLPALLRSRREDVLPAHLRPVRTNVTADYITPQ
jgi:CDP-L-myo-inositol myo-inositolphosphotransferase